MDGITICDEQQMDGITICDEPPVAASPILATVVNWPSMVGPTVVYDSMYC